MSVFASSSSVRRLLLKAVAAPLAALALASHAAAAYPDKPITLIVPFNAGTTPDIVSRLLADAIGRDIGQTMVVMNRVGASGIIGTQALINAPADGYTIAYANVATLAIWVSAVKRLWASTRVSSRRVNTASPTRATSGSSKMVVTKPRARNASA